MALVPESGCQPEVRIRLEVLRHLLKSGIILLFLAHQEFSLIKETRLLDAVLDALVY
jgi:hypothetical protein